MLLTLSAARGAGRNGVWVISAMLALLSVRVLVITPAIAELRATGAVGSSQFAVLHGASVVV